MAATVLVAIAAACGEPAAGEPSPSPTAPANTRPARTVVLPAPAAHRGLVPAVTVVGDRASFQMTFTDGKTVVVDYPAQWRLEQHGWRPSTLVTLELGDAPREGWGYFPANLLFAYGGPGPVTDAADPDGLTELTVQAGRWFGTVLLDRARWTAADLELLRTHLRVVGQPDGFPVVETDPPLAHLTADPSQRSTATEAAVASVLVGDVMELLAECQTQEVVSTITAVVWCVPGAGIGVTARAPASMHDELVREFAIRLP